MSSTNPAWQGAVHVARARLQTIDEALAKLEAIVPDVEDSAPPKDQVPDRPAPPADQKASEHKPTNQAKPQIKKTNIEPSPIPHPSLQALETFIEETYQKRYVPEVV